jgi:hypothetical protein
LNKFHSPPKKRKKDRSLNRAYRKREILRIARENAKVFQRINS